MWKTPPTISRCRNVDCRYEESHLDIDWDQRLEGCGGSIAFLFLAADLDDVVGLLRLAFLMLLLSVRDFDLHVEVCADSLQISSSGAHDGPVMALIYVALYGHLIVKVGHDLGYARLGGIHAVLGALQRDLEGITIGAEATTIHRTFHVASRGKRTLSELTPDRGNDTITPPNSSPI